MGRVLQRPPSPVTATELVDLLAGEARILESRVQNATWYLFGSMLHSPSVAKDIDVLIVYRHPEDVGPIRDQLETLCQLLPIDLMLASSEEERELSFVARAGCRQIHPRLDIGLSSC
jgi:hypothetical protein